MARRGEKSDATYAFDSSEPTKQQIAINRIDDAVRNGSGVISTQVLG